MNGSGMKLLRCVPLLAAISLAAGCGGGGSQGPVPAATPVVPADPANQTSIDSNTPELPGDPLPPPIATPPVLPPARPVPPVSGSDFAIDSVDWLEPVVLQTADQGFALTTARAVQVRAMVTTAGVDKPAPRVRIRVVDSSGAVLASADMSGPATVKPGADRASIADNFVFQLKSEWVKPGVKLSIVANPDGLATDPTPANNSIELAPAVNPAAVMYVTAVPVTTEVEGTAILPRSGNGEAATRAAIRSTLMAMYPLSDVKVRLRAPYKMTSLTTMRGNWGLMLGEVNKLRIAEGNHGYYIGFIPHSTLGSTTTGNSFMPGTVATAMGAANPTAWRSGNVQHEIGHNFNLGHVACTPIGGAGEFGYDAEVNAIVPLAARNNMMSYCGPAWISKTNYAAVQRRLTQYGLDTPNGVTIPLGDWK
jgi:hypothetical protein